MQNHEYFYPDKFAVPLAPEAADTYLHAPLVSALDAVLPSGARPLTPFKRVELQPSEVCPKNFIIFDQTDNQSRIMFHPAMENKFSGPGLNVHATYNRDSEKNKANPVEGELSSPFEEDSKDIDALLSLEGKELEDHDEEELSTARTNITVKWSEGRGRSFFALLPPVSHTLWVQTNPESPLGTRDFPRDRTHSTGVPALCADDTFHQVSQPSRAGARKILWHCVFQSKQSNL